VIGRLPVLIDSHPYAEVFPPMTSVEFNALKLDIEANGQLEPITLFEGKVLDGRHRDRVCSELGIETQCVDLPDGVDPVQFVVSKNLHRRNLSKSQRAVAAIRSQELQEKLRTKAHERMSAGGRGGMAVLEGSAGLQQGRTEAQLGALFGVSSRYIAAARAIEKKAPEELDRITVGETTVNAVYVGLGKPQTKVKLPVEERRRQIRALVDKGFRASQIADKLGISVEHVQTIARNHDITLPVAKHSSTIDPNHVVESVVVGLEASVFSLDLIKGRYDQLDRNQIEYWVSSLKSSLPHIRKLRNDLSKELTHDQY
jgi:hypothetical protein